MSKTLRLLIVDDSALMRRVLRSIFESDPTICVVGEAANGSEALHHVATLRPDVITLDVQMPVLDGLKTTEKLMAYHPTPILVITASLSRRDVDITFKMLDAGALEVVEKPSLSDPEAMERAKRELIRKVKLLARVKVVMHIRGRRRIEPETPQLEPRPAVHMQPVAQPTTAGAFPVVIIGASTGGPRIIHQILAGLPRSFGAALIVVQHIAEGFSYGMAEWLAETLTLPVTLAHEGVRISAGTVFVVPDRSDLLIKPGGFVHLNRSPLLLHRPAIDIAMQSVAEIFGPRVIGILLTGMGRDGVIGMQSIKRARGYTIAQDEASCTVYGMPRAAIEAGAIDAVLSPEGIVQALLQRVKA